MSARHLIAGLMAVFVALPAQAALKVETATLGHKVEAWYVRSDSVPVVDILLSFEGAGATSDPTGKEGRAMFAANMLTEGADDLDALAFSQALEGKAITIEIGAFDDRLVVHLHALKDAAPRAGELLAKALLKPRFADADMQRIRTAMLSHLRQLNEDPDYLAERGFEQHAFAGHPYARSMDGTPESLAAMNANDLRDYLATYVTRGKLLVTASGDVNESLLKDMLTPLVKALPDGTPIASVPSAKLQEAGTLVTLPQDVPQSVVVFAAEGIDRHDKRFYAAYLLNQVLGGNGLVSRLADVVRQQKGLVYNISTALETRSGISLLHGSFATRTSTAAEALATVKATLADVQDHGVTSQECNEARTYVLGSFPLQLDGSESVDSALLMMRMYDLGEDYLSKRADYFNAVRCSDINAVAHDLLDPKRFLYMMVGREQPATPPAVEKKP